MGGAVGGDAVLNSLSLVRDDCPRDAQGAMKLPDAWRKGVVAVVGLGKSGVAATRLLVREGVRVYASDSTDHPYAGAAAESLPALPGVEGDLGRHDLAKNRPAAGVAGSP